MAAHNKFTVATDVSVYFCDPKSPWQRGTSENTNRLLRQYLPKDMVNQAEESAAKKIILRTKEILDLWKLEPRRPTSGQIPFRNGKDARRAAQGSRLGGLRWADSGQRRRGFQGTAETAQER
jgi:hypothetical protein